MGHMDDGAHDPLPICPITPVPPHLYALLLCPCVPLPMCSITPVSHVDPVVVNT